MFKPIVRITAAALAAGAIAFAITIAPAAHIALKTSTRPRSRRYCHTQRSIVFASRSGEQHARCAACQTSSRSANLMSEWLRATRGPFGSSPFASRLALNYR